MWSDAVLTSLPPLIHDRHVPFNPVALPPKPKSPLMRLSYASIKNGLFFYAAETLDR